MEITLEGLSLGKPTIIKDKEYFSTNEYVHDFITEMSKFTNKFVVHVQVPSQLTLSETSKDITYNKVWIQAIMPSKCDVEEYHEVYGLVYALDTRVPVYKVYRAYINSENQNLCVFDPQWIQTHELKPGEKFKFSISNLMSMTSNFNSKLEKSKHTFISLDEKDNHELLGRLIERSLLYEYKTIGGKVKLSPSDVVKTYESIFYDPSSKYYLGEAKGCSLHHYQDALCSFITDSKDIVNRFEKTLLVQMLFDLVDNEENN